MTTAERGIENSALVVGAGPTGLTLACGLAGAGVNVRVVDGAAGPSLTSRALGLQPRGVEVLDRCGALGDLEGRANPIRRVLLDVGGPRVARLEMGRASALVTRPGIIISQAEVEGSLRERLLALDHRVEWGRTVGDVVQDAEGVLVRFADGEQLRCGWVVGCDGAHSAVRKLAGIAFPGVPLIERFLLADVGATLPIPPESVSVWLRGQDLLAAFPLPGADRWRLMATAPDTMAAPPPRPMLVATVSERLHAWTGWPKSSIGGVDWTSTFVIQRRLASTYRVGRLLLAGDAAHIHSPFGGQGMNTGMGDAENLAWKLALVIRSGADAALLDSYEAERRPIAEEVLAATSGLTRLILGDSRISRLIRDRIFVPSLNRRVVQRLIADRASQLKTTYRDGPLGRRDHRMGGGRTRPGDRVPDLACTDAEGAEVRLHAALRQCWVLLIPADRGTEPQTALCVATAVERLGQASVSVLEGHGVRDVLLVRPDAHLAWRGSSSTELGEWFTSRLQLPRADGQEIGDYLAPVRCREVPIN